MDNFLFLLREAFNESANYLAWAFYSLLAAYISVALFSSDKYKSKASDRFSKILFLIYALICIPNLFFIVGVFKDKFGALGAIIAGTAALFMLILNAGPAVYGVMQQHKKD